MTVPLFNLRAQHRTLGNNLVRTFRSSLRRTNFILGDDVEAFERAFAKFVRTRFAVGVASGADALKLALIAAGVRPGEDVIVPALTFAATAHAVVQIGARPRFVDVDEYATIDVAKIGRRGRAIIPVHLYGQPADMDAILKAGMPVIEDAAQAVGAIWRGRHGRLEGKPVGSIGDFGAFSFYPSKNLGALGDAGLVTTNDAKAAATLRMWRHVGQRVKNRHDVAGFNSRLDAIQAAFLRVKLRRIGAWNRRRRAIAAEYRRRMRGVEVPRERPHATHVYHLFVVRTPRRDALMRHLASRGIESGVYYPTPLPLQPAMKAFGGRRGEFPVAERWCREGLALPIYPELSGADVRRVIDAVNSF